MSSSASRAWMTSGSPVWRAAAIWRAEPRACDVLRRVVVVVVEPGLADATQRGCARQPDQSSAVDVRLFGRVVRMRADRAETSSDSARRSPAPRRIASRGSRSSPCCRRRPPRARASTPSRSVGELGEVEVAVAVDEHRGLRRQPVLGRFDIAREHRLRRRQDACRRTSRVCASAHGEAALVGRHRQQVEQLRGRARHKGWARMATPADHFGGRRRAPSPCAPDRSSQRPGLLPGEVAVGLADAPRQIAASATWICCVHRLCAPARAAASARSSDRLVGLVQRAALGTTPPQFLAIIDSERCARLPRSLARSALVRLTIASWL